MLHINPRRTQQPGRGVFARWVGQCDVLGGSAVMTYGDSATGLLPGLL